jgi:hypothetical protein
MITQKKSYITQPGQKPFERSKLIPNKGNITTEQFLSDVNKNKKPIPYSTKTDTFDGGSKKELTVTAPKLKPKTQVTPPTKQEVKPTQKTTTPTKQSTTVNNQKATVKPKEEVKTTPKQTYLKPKGEVNMKVKLFQKMLLDEGFDLGKTADDGIWGAKTQEAFEKLQANKANYAIAMEKFKQLDEELQPKTIQAPQQFLPPRFAPASPATLPAFKKGGTMKKKSKKCSCGCAMKISKNAKGGLIESCACGCKMKKHEKGGKVTTNDSIQAYNRINAGESESGKGPKDKKEVIGQVRKGNFGPGNTKATFNKELKNKK